MRCDNLTPMDGNLAVHREMVENSKGGGRSVWTVWVDNYRFRNNNIQAGWSRTFILLMVD